MRDAEEAGIAAGRREDGVPMPDSANDSARRADADGGVSKNQATPRKREGPGVIGGTLSAQVPQHVSEDEPELDAVDRASADSFPASDPSNQP